MYRTMADVRKQSKALSVRVLFINFLGSKSLITSCHGFVAIATALETADLHNKSLINQRDRGRAHLTLEIDSSNRQKACGSMSRT